MFLWRRVAPQSPEEGLKPTAAPGYMRNFRDLNRKIAEGKSFSGYERNALFLNLKGAGFADVAPLFGVDFDDDARAVAVIDWDRDGALDLWVTNRTAPRVRLLKNNHHSANSFLAIRLVGNGTSTNRDAVGARLTLWESAAPRLRQLRTIRAGDGFLSQSSLWTHFGLGHATGPLELTVAWPGGGTETFSNLKPNAHYTIRQGEGQAVPTVARALKVPPPPGPESEEDPGANGFWVANRVPFPQVSYTDAAGSVCSTSDFAGKPVLVNLWATWCAPCLKELSDLGKQQDALRARNATMLALNVDRLALDRGGGSAGTPEDVLARANYALPHGIAQDDTLARIEVVVEFLTSRRGPLPIPSSFLLDSQSNVAAVYLGPLSWDRLDADFGMLEAPSATQLGRVSARPGRWFADPRQVDRAAYLGDYATLFASSGMHDESQRVYRLIKPQDGARSARDLYNQAKSAAQQGATDQAIEHYRGALRLEPEFGEALTGLGALLLLQKRADEAQPLFEKALRLDPNHATALVNLAMIDQSRGKPESALARLRTVVARNPDFAEARLNLGSLLASLKRHDEAIQHLSKALEINPKLAVAHLNLAAAYLETRQWARAEDHYRKVQSLNPRIVQAYLGLGKVQALEQKHADAVVSFRQAITLGSANAQTYTQLALSLLPIGEKQPAFDALKKALELDPQYAPAKQALRESGFSAKD